MMHLNCYEDLLETKFRGADNKYLSTLGIKMLKYENFLGIIQI